MKQPHTSSTCTDRAASNPNHPIVSDPFTVTFIQIKARQLCRRSDFSKSDFDDLCQEMRLYLLAKAHRFDPVRGNLEAFVTNALQTWVAMELRYRSRVKRTASFKAISLDGARVEFEGQTVDLGAVLVEDDGQRRTQAYPISPLEHFEMREAIDSVMQKLSPEDRLLLASVAEHGIRATARAMGVSWRQVTNALVRIRPDFEKAGLGVS